MDGELYLDLHIRELVIKALSKSETKEKAAKLLGIHLKTLNSYIEKYKIKFKYSVWEVN